MLTTTADLLKNAMNNQVAQDNEDHQVILPRCKVTMATANHFGRTGSVAPPAEDARLQRETDPGGEFHYACRGKK